MAIVNLITINLYFLHGYLFERQLAKLNTDMPEVLQDSLHGRAAIQTVSDNISMTAPPENFLPEKNSLVEDSVNIKSLTISRQMFSFHSFKWLLMENEDQDRIILKIQAKVSTLLASGQDTDQKEKLIKEQQEVIECLRRQLEETKAAN